MMKEMLFILVLLILLANTILVTGKLQECEYSVYTGGNCDLKCNDYSSCTCNQVSQSGVVSVCCPHDYPSEGLTGCSKYAHYYLAHANRGKIITSTTLGGCGEGNTYYYICTDDLHKKSCHYEENGADCCEVDEVWISDEGKCVGLGCYPDLDHDGYGDKNGYSGLCLSGTVTNNDDCYDEDNEMYPGNTEVCDGKDNDCDGTVDEGLFVKNVAPADEWDSFSITNGSATHQTLWSFDSNGDGHYDVVKIKSDALSDCDTYSNVGLRFVNDDVIQ